MNIIDNRGSNFVKFNEIEVGECFEYDGHVYLKTNVFYGWDDDIKYNVINLNSSGFDFFHDRIQVLKINATLSIDYSMEE